MATPGRPGSAGAFGAPLRRTELDEDELYIWIDYLSIPQANLASLQDALSKWETLSSARKLVEENGARAEKFSEYKRQAQKAVSQLLANQVDVFCEKVTACLPDGWEFGVMVTDHGHHPPRYCTGDDGRGWLCATRAV